MTDYVDSCPNCDHKPSGSWGTATLYRCEKCAKRFCYKCPASCNGEECPKCGSRDKREIARIG